MLRSISDWIRNWLRIRAGTGWGIGAGTGSGTGDGIGWGIGPGTGSGSVRCGLQESSVPVVGLATAAGWGSGKIGYWSRNLWLRQRD